ncbi:unnamed protein product [Chironomus riparius]|uniref:Tetraspanin n=1 Tax=Chironomus riparius TaxID=315576 RepID=A0A9N9WSP2_9DIPT|nr:unnamed protein product [Chironomus riparius]
MKSERSYNCLFRTLIFLFILEILAGISIALICEYVKLFIQSHFFQIDKHEVQSVIFIIKLYGLHISICYCCGFAVILLFDDVYTRHLGVLIKLWIFLTIESAIGCLFTTWLFVDTMNYVTANFEASLIKGLELYPQDPHWVLIWDDLQYDYKCCGVHNHTDWMKIKFPRDETRISSWLPFSCAKGNIPLKANLNDENIYIKGCFYIISEMIEMLISITVSMNVVIAIIMILIIIMMRTVFTYKRIYTEISPDFESEEVFQVRK